ncbi:Lamina-associated polypeptide 2, isoforms beta/delta/epsilon/gamma [Merluccius polli]|uniref:Lamina-associated polypeptide 2, isoforms beta/delta/epsilon/gamma n=1 Tax=Merluccius polli TaxID=89951 RepID=A0AA47MM75_MERPO|nr:Lamina-associated polypeptide 2, isoforms beta/delta/epsilon/gamma [Merluccius polli]
MPPEMEGTNAHVAKGKQQKITPFLSDLSPVKRHGCVAIVSKESYFNKVEKMVVVDQTPRAEDRDVLKEVFANDVNSPTGILASCRKPIRGAAGRPIQPSDFWKDETLLLSPKSISTTTSSTSSYSEIRHRSTNLTLPTLPSSSLSASRLVTTAPPAGQTKAARRGFSIWLKLFFLVLLVSFLFFVYQTMEANVLSPFSSSETEQVGTEGTA